MYIRAGIDRKQDEKAISRQLEKNKRQAEKEKKKIDREHQKEKSKAVSIGGLCFSLLFFMQ